MTNELLFLEEVAAKTRTSVSTVRYWIATGKLASTRPGRRRMVSQRELDRFLSESRRAPQAQPPPTVAESSPKGPEDTNRGEAL